MNEEERWKDIDNILNEELYPDKYCYIHNYIIKLQQQLEQKDRTIEDYMILVEKVHKKLEQQNIKPEYDRLLQIAKRMHLLIFLHSGDEQKVYDEIGLTDEDNIILGYSGQFKLKEENKK